MSENNYLAEADALWRKSPKPLSPEVAREVVRLYELYQGSRGSPRLNAAGPPARLSTNQAEARRQELGILLDREQNMILAVELRRAAEDLEAANQPLSNATRRMVKDMFEDAAKLERANQPPPTPSASTIAALRSKKESGAVLVTCEVNLLAAAEYRDTVAQALSENTTITSGMKQILLDLLTYAEKLERENA